MPGYRSPSSASPAGPSSTRAGNVTGSRPDGSASPTSMSARASAPSSPGYQVMRTAPAREAQGMSTGEPALTTTTVRAVDLEHGLDQLALATGQRQVGAVVPLGLPLPVGADDDHGDVGLGGGGNRTLELVARVRGRGAEARSHDRGRGRPRPDVDGELVGAPGGEVERHLDRLAARRRRSWNHATGSVLSTTTSPVEAEDGPSGALEPEPPRARHVGHERRGQPDRARPDGEPGCGGGRSTAPERYAPTPSPPEHRPVRGCRSTRSEWSRRGPP